ncbi:hypothetical protein HDU76_000592 [Blyttiomyces sp. JEL0837]|nr:hypothetical protein HDU76_000592 [Blyttiomyces sp. JEL0837]
MNIGTRKRKVADDDDDDDDDDIMFPVEAKDINDNSNSSLHPKLALPKDYTRSAVRDGKVANGVKLHEYVRYDSPNDGKRVAVFIRWIADMEMEYVVDGRKFTVIYTPSKLEVEGLLTEEMEEEEKKTGKMAARKKAFIQYFTTDPMDEETFCYSFDLPDNIDSKAIDEDTITFVRHAWPANGGEKMVAILVPVFQVWTFDISSQKKRRHSLSQFARKAN